MPTVKSLDDLKKIREEALKKREIKSSPAAFKSWSAWGRPALPQARAKPSRRF